MSKQITVRLPDDLVDFIDDLVAQEAQPSRASVVARAVERERRRERAIRDAAILIEKRNADLDDLAAYAANQQLDID
ncbi:MAG: ribbon-helix-helix domain-containing protein [Actinomycetia bacterium]|nr:ribbon-helix-helix domain-containing protein [Actinomycetes bacterium]